MRTHHYHTTEEALRTVVTAALSDCGSAAISAMRRACVWSSKADISIADLVMRGLGVGAGGLSAAMRCRRVRVAVSAIGSPGSDFARLIGRAARGCTISMFSIDRFDDLQRGWQARPGPCG